VINSTAILIFTQEVEKDASRKLLTPHENMGVNKIIFNKLNNFVEQISTSTNLPTFTSRQFVKNNHLGYGKQLTQAINAVFEKGFEKIICVGNDCPGLDKVQILNAAQKLQTNDTVVGPDLRGGVYLIGLSKNNFCANTFENLAWQSEKMLSSYLDSFPNQQISFLESLADIHTFEELQTYTSSRHFIQFLINIIEKTFIIFRNTYTSFYNYHFLRVSYLRGPPIY
jgi:uncharacterized protein